MPRHCRFGKHYRSVRRAHAQVLQNLVVQEAMFWIPATAIRQPHNAVADTDFAATQCPTINSNVQVRLVMVVTDDSH